MNRHEQSIQLSDHVKNKLKHYGYSPTPAPLRNPSDELSDINDDSVFFSPLTSATRERRDTFTTYEMTQTAKLLSAGKKSNHHKNASSIQENNRDQEECQECVRRYQKLQFERQQLLRLYEENKKLNDQLRAYVQLNHQYEEDIQRLKYYLRKVNSHLYDYQINFEQLKQKLASEKQKNRKFDKEQYVEIDEDEHKITNDHLKRLRHEIHMYNRSVAAKQQQENKRLQ